MLAEKRIELAMQRVRKVYRKAALKGINGTPYKFRVVGFDGYWAGGCVMINPRIISADFIDPDDAWMDAEAKIKCG